MLFVFGEEMMRRKQDIRQRPAPQRRGEVAVHELVLLLVEETDAGMYGPAGSEKTFVLKVMGALPLGHVFVEASTARGHDD
jgi:hypothetical protein